jgi:gas vesicle protein GvpL/GvpF
VIHLYGVVEELEELPDIGGIDDAPLESRRVAGLQLVLSRAAGELSASEEAVLQHARVVEELMARSGSVLPAQLGHGFADETELSRAVATKAEALERGLTRVRGCVEFGLRALAPERSSGDEVPASGHDYMRLRLAEAKQRDRLAGEVHEALAPLSRETVRSRGGPAELLRAAYLVTEDKAGAFCEQVDRLTSRHPELTLICTGPWPPYSFAAEREGSS